MPLSDQRWPSISLDIVHDIFLTVAGQQISCQLCCVRTSTRIEIQIQIFCCPDASVVHVSGSGQLQANPHVEGPWLSPGKPTRRVVTMMGSDDLVVGEDHMLGQNFQRYNWQMGRCGSIVEPLTAA